MKGIHKLFEDVVAEHGGRTALRYLGNDVTYRQLDAKANALAQELTELSVRNGDIVAVALPTSDELIVAFLAVLKCGAAYLPLDDANPPQRNAGFLEAARVRVIIVGHADLDEIFSRGRTVVRLADFTYEDTRFRSFDSNPDAKAYVMFTSGSTGSPKGVVIPHRGVVRLVRGTNYISIKQDDRILQLAPPSFDASTFEIWGALINGATLVPYSGSVFDPSQLKNDIRENGITVLWLTAALFHLVADKAIDALEPLRVLLAGGDVLNARCVNRVLNSVPGITVINGYGPTENTTFTCCHVMTAKNKPVSSVSIGKPVIGTRVHILDDSLTPVSVGSVGELYASGNGVGLGYLNAPEGDGFFFDESVAPGRIYRTGDLVKSDTNGDIHFVGRRDNLIKVRGYRVSLEEICTHVLRLEGVVDAIVVKKELPEGDQILVAYVNRASGSVLDGRAVRRGLSEYIPKYMIPDQIVFDHPFAINENGKIDRAAILANLTQESENIEQQRSDISHH